MVFQFTSWHLTLALKGQIKVLWFHWVCIIDNVLLTAELSGREASCYSPVFTVVNNGHACIPYDQITARDHGPTADRMSFITASHRRIWSITGSLTNRICFACYVFYYFNKQFTYLLTIT